ncbi:HNH endonuclease [Candidatus Shapirobacteria bacterium]|nr:HNH endonuclease [Candidatus Shapirobacteria bacterium]
MKNKIYNGTWRKLRNIQLSTEPLCRMCAKRNIIKAATTIDHIIPISERPDLRLEQSNLQSLCKQCHDSIKRRIDQGSYGMIGINGLPKNKKHHWNRGGQSKNF